MMNRGPGESSKAQGIAGSNDGSRSEKRNLLQAKWSAVAESNHTERERDQEPRTSHGEPATEEGNSSEHQEQSTAPPLQGSPNSETQASNSRANDLVKPSELVHQVQQLATSLLQLAQSLEQLESVLHQNAMPLAPKESHLSQLVKDRPDLQALIRQYLFK